MNTFTLKSIALFLMVIDHIALYFEGMPIWFNWLGRSSYPLFLFCMVWGYHYTKNRKKYLLRLYFMSIFMTVFRYLVESSFASDNMYGNHNIFLSMFIVGILISTIELFQKNRKKGFIAIGIIFFVQISYYFIIPPLFPIVRSFSGDFLTGVVPNIVLNEYGFEFIALGVLMYFLKEKKDLFSIMYIIFCISQFSGEMLEVWSFSQCFMILALPLMLRYNNQKGIGMKHFFYIFYPAHTFFLFYIANFVLVN